MSDGKELVWVPWDVAKEYGAITDDNKKLEFFQEFLSKKKKEVKADYHSELECMKEDIAIQKGLMLEVKQAFAATIDESLSSSYKAWEKYDIQKSELKKKAMSIVNELKPLKEELGAVEKILSSINTYGFDRVIETVKTISSMWGKDRDMIDFLINNYKHEED